MQRGGSEAWPKRWDLEKGEDFGLVSGPEHLFQHMSEGANARERDQRNSHPVPLCWRVPKSL